MLCLQILSTDDHCICSVSLVCAFAMLCVCAVYRGVRHKLGIESIGAFVVALYSFIRQVL